MSAPALTRRNIETSVLTTTAQQERYEALAEELHEAYAANCDGEGADQTLQRARLAADVAAAFEQTATALKALAAAESEKPQAVESMPEWLLNNAVERFETMPTFGDRHHGDFLVLATHSHDVEHAKRSGLSISYPTTIAEALETVDEQRRYGLTFVAIAARSPRGEVTLYTQDGRGVLAERRAGGKDEQIVRLPS